MRRQDWLCVGGEGSRSDGEDEWPLPFLLRGKQAFCYTRMADSTLWAFEVRLAYLLLSLNPDYPDYHSASTPRRFQVDATWIGDDLGLRTGAQRELEGGGEGAYHCIVLVLIASRSVWRGSDSGWFILILTHLLVRR